MINSNISKSVFIALKISLGVVCISLIVGIFSSFHRVGKLNDYIKFTENLGTHLEKINQIGVTGKEGAIEKILEMATKFQDKISTRIYERPKHLKRILISQIVFSLFALISALISLITEGKISLLSLIAFCFFFTINFILLNAYFLQE